MEAIRNLSLRKTIVRYVTVSLVISFFLNGWVVYMASRLQKNIWVKYTTEEYSEIQIEMDQKGYLFEVPKATQNSMTESDNFLSELCDFLQTWSSLFFPFAGCIIAVYLFYRHKIVRPLEEMVKGSRMISENDLDFTIDYQNKDELGVLCGKFEIMRQQLWENNSRMWKMIEQEKALRWAVAHDIRSPLTVMKGYQEMLLEFLPDQQLEPEKVFEILEAGMREINRMNDFVETMRKLSSLEERKAEYTQFDTRQLTEQIKATAEAMGKKEGKTWEIRGMKADSKVMGDSRIILEVADNLIANAMGYASGHVCIRLEIDNCNLKLSVLDDGNGFQEDTEKVTQAYYHSNPQGDLNHWGLGLYICRLYCENHGGKLLLGNNLEGGACARAIFRIKPLLPNESADDMREAGD